MDELTKEQIDFRKTMLKISANGVMLGLGGILAGFFDKNGEQIHGPLGFFLAATFGLAVVSFLYFVRNYVELRKLVEL